MPESHINVCITNQLPDPNIFSLKTKCNESKSGCSSTVMGKNKRLHLSSTSLTGQSISQIQEKTVLCTSNDPSMTKPSMLHDPTKNPSRESNFVTTNQTSFGKFPI